MLSREGFVRRGFTDIEPVYLHEQRLFSMAVRVQKLVMDLKNLSICLRAKQVTLMVCVQMEGYKYAGDDQKKDIKLRFFHTNSNIRANHVFHPVVSCPTPEDRKPRVDWTKFHSIIPVHQEDKNHSGHLHSLMQVWRQSSKHFLCTVDCIKQLSKQFIITLCYIILCYIVQCVL